MPPEGAGSNRNARRRAAALARQEAARAEERRERRQRLRVIAVASVLGVGTAGAGIAYLVDRDRRGNALEARLVAGDCTRDTRSDRTEGDGHVERPTYEVEPPAGGDHTPSVARAGTYSAEDAPPDGQLVHALEHGYVVLWHRPALTPAELAQVRAVREARPGDVIVVERPGLPVAVAATAWEQRLLCPAVEPDALDAFAERFVGEGPEDVPRG